MIWATGYRPDYSWLGLPVMDRKGLLRHDGGIVDAPGVYAMGLPFMRRRKSTLIDGAGDDPESFADHMVSQFRRMAAEPSRAMEPFRSRDLITTRSSSARAAPVRRRRCCSPAPV